MTIILTLLEFKRDEVANNANVANNNNNIPSFEYKENLLGNTETNGAKKE